MLASFQRFIQSFSSSQKKFAVAISGGIDSVVLSELCAQCRLPFLLVHCNFGLRGEESERDEAFVRSLGEKYKVDVLVKRFDTNAYAAEKKRSIQEAARELRYSWFAELHQGGKADFILLAHHANDNIETVLMNFFRGTGLEGLTGMPWMVPYAYCLRPLLQHTRREIEEFAKENNLEWVEDSSNQSSKYTRNFFRNELIPAIKKVYPQVEENLLNNIERFQKINPVYQLGLAQLKKEVCEYKEIEVHISINKLLKYKGTSLLYELISEYGFGEKQVEELIKLAETESGKYIENDEFQIIRHRKKIIIAPKIVRTETAVIEKETKILRLANANLSMQFIEIEKFNLSKDPLLAQLDAGLIQFPLLVRKWQQGDYFYPLGMRKKKKLARFFIDQKLSKVDKEKVYVIDSGKRIIWVAGLRIDDRFKITPSTKNVLQLIISNP